MNLPKHPSGSANLRLDSHGEKSGRHQDLSTLELADFAVEVEDSQDFLHSLAQHLMGDHVKSRTRISDVVQQTLLQAFRDQTMFRGKTRLQLREWLATILRHRIADEARKAKTAAAKQMLSGHSPLENGRLVSHATPASELVKKEQITRLLTAIEDLPEQLRVIVRLRYLEGRSFNEIGDVCCLSHDIVRRLWLKSLRILGGSIQ
jgi:RNA polymerase sigma factor (sigma-70 family)